MHHVKDFKNKYKIMLLADPNPLVFLYKLLRLTGEDLPNHLERVYFCGTNAPDWLALGGPWVWPSRCPQRIASIVSESEYAKLVDNVTSAMKYGTSWLDFEQWTLVFAYVFLPAHFNQYFVSVALLSFNKIYFYFADIFLILYLLFIQTKLRKKRALKLLEMISSYDHSCFLSEKQRFERRSIRVSISIDFTLVYIDFLIDANPKELLKPLSLSGQPKFPLYIRFSGTGTYFTPWHLDTNDSLVQSVPNCNTVECFIDASWFEFVANLNMQLHGVNIQDSYRGLEAISQFMHEKCKEDSLGGVQVNLCILSNINNIRREPVDLEAAAPQFKQNFDFAAVYKELQRGSLSLGIVITHTSTPLSDDKKWFKLDNDVVVDRVVMSDNPMLQKSSDITKFVKEESNNATCQAELSNEKPSIDVEVQARLEQFGRDEMTSLGEVLRGDSGARQSDISTRGTQSFIGSQYGDNQSEVGDARSTMISARESSKHNLAIDDQSINGDEISLILHHEVSSDTIWRWDEGLLMVRSYYDILTESTATNDNTDELDKQQLDIANVGRSTKQQIMKGIEKLRYGFRLLFLGRNVYPHFMHLQPIARPMLQLLCIADFCLFASVFLSIYCSLDPSGQCSNHIALYVILGFWPLAIVLLITPLRGFAVTLFDDTGVVPRVYSIWAKFATFSYTTLLVYYITYVIIYSSTQSNEGAKYKWSSPIFIMLVLMGGSRITQAYLIELYIAFNETKRRGRGWDGLATSITNASEFGDFH